MNVQRDAFLAGLQLLLKKHNIEAHYFYGIDAEGAFGDYSISPEEVTDMVFDVFHHEEFTSAAEEITQVIAQELMGGNDSSIDLSALDEMRWTWRKKD